MTVKLTECSSHKFPELYPQWVGKHHYLTDELTMNQLSILPCSLWQQESELWPLTIKERNITAWVWKKNLSNSLYSIRLPLLSVAPSPVKRGSNSAWSKLCYRGRVPWWYSGDSIWRKGSGCNRRDFPLRIMGDVWTSSYPWTFALVLFILNRTFVIPVFKLAGNMHWKHRASVGKSLPWWVLSC